MKLPDFIGLLNVLVAKNRYQEKSAAIELQYATDLKKLTNQKTILLNFFISNSGISKVPFIVSDRTIFIPTIRIPIIVPEIMVKLIYGPERSTNLSEAIIDQFHTSYTYQAPSVIVHRNTTDAFHFSIS